MDLRIQVRLDVREGKSLGLVVTRSFCTISGCLGGMETRAGPALQVGLHSPLTPTQGYPVISREGRSISRLEGQDPALETLGDLASGTWDHLLKCLHLEKRLTQQKNTKKL